LVSLRCRTSIPLYGSRNWMMPVNDTRTDVAQSTTRQIHDAIDLLQAGKIESAIVVAHAAEGKLPETGKPHLFHKLKEFAESLPKSEQGAKGPNDFINWLKHGRLVHKNPRRVFCLGFFFVATMTVQLPIWVS
jgi:hypothetical protein